jgi:hypothetical protein
LAARVTLAALAGCFFFFSAAGSLAVVAGFVSALPVERFGRGSLFVLATRQNLVKISCSTAWALVAT